MDAIYEHILARITLGLYANYANRRIGSCSLFDVSYSVHYFGDVNYSRFKSGAGKRPMERTLPPSGIQAEHFVFFSAAAAAEKWIRVGVWGGKRSSNQPAATRATKRVIHTEAPKDSAGGCSRLEDDTAATNNNYHQMFVSLLGVAMKKRSKYRWAGNTADATSNLPVTLRSNWQKPFTHLTLKSDSP